MKCYLHIGTEKTGTTAIQTWLSKNRTDLLANGYIFTKLAGGRNNRALPVLAYKDKRRDSYTNQLGIKSDSELKLFQKKKFLSLKNEIERLKNEVTQETATIIFSSEHIQSCLTDIVEIERLKEKLWGLGVDDCYVVLYLRRPAEIANSLYTEHLKYGGTLDSPPYPKDSDYFATVCNHKATTEKFSKVFGEKKMVLRIFNRDEFKNGSIINDFADVTGIPIEKCNHSVQSANESLSALGAMLIRNLNVNARNANSLSYNEMLNYILSYVQNNFTDSKYIMRKDLFEAYDLEFQESNEWIRSNYFPSRERLFSDKVPDESNLQLNANEIKSFINLLEDLWSRQIKS